MTFENIFGKENTGYSSTPFLSDNVFKPIKDNFITWDFNFVFCKYLQEGQL